MAISAFPSPILFVFCIFFSILCGFRLFSTVFTNMMTSPCMHYSPVTWICVGLHMILIFMNYSLVLTKSPNSYRKRRWWMIKTWLFSLKSLKCLDRKIFPDEELPKLVEIIPILQSNVVENRLNSLRIRSNCCDETQILSTILKFHETIQISEKFGVNNTVFVYEY